MDRDLSWELDHGVPKLDPKSSKAFPFELSLCLGRVFKRRDGSVWRLEPLLFNSPRRLSMDIDWIYVALSPESEA